VLGVKSLDQTTQMGNGSCDDENMKYLMGRKE